MKDTALAIATAAHAGQFRLEGVPYITHPVSVAQILSESGMPEIVVVSGLVHDVLEDTTTAASVLLQELGPEVLSIVEAVSEDKSLPWRARKEGYIASVRAASSSAKAVSIADKIHNLESLFAAHQIYGKEFLTRFKASFEEKRWFEESMLAMFEETWQHPLIARYRDLVARMPTLPE